MENLSRLLLYQRLRNRFIELLEWHSSIEHLALLGAFEAINTVDFLFPKEEPLDFEQAPKVFSGREKEVMKTFLVMADEVADITEHDTWDASWFEKSAEWCELMKVARHASTIFDERGRFSDDFEELSLI